MFRFSVLAFFMLSQGFLYAEDEVSKHFLLNLRAKYKSNRGLPIGKYDFSSQLSFQEEKFLENTLNYDFQDIFKGTLTEARGVRSYNLFNFGSSVKRRRDRRHMEGMFCEMVYTEDAKQFYTQNLKEAKKIPIDIEGKDVWSFSYCAGLDKNTDHESVLYFFHGAKGGPLNWLDRNSTYSVRKRWRKFGKLPRWVSVSIGSIGHLAEIKKEERFFDTIVPYIERKLGMKTPPKKRFGLGVSQGGANIVHAVLKRENFFDAAVAVCPAISTTNPGASKEELKLYRVRTAAWKYLLKLAFHFVPLEFFEFDYWRENVDPLILGQKYLSSKSTPLYIQTSSQDELGLQEGGQLFAMLARAKGAPVVFEELQGSHCVLRPKKIADFLMSFQNGELPLQLKMLGRTR